MPISKCPTVGSILSKYDNGTVKISPTSALLGLNSDVCNRTTTACSLTPMADTKQSKGPNNSICSIAIPSSSEHSLIAASAPVLSTLSQWPPGKLISPGCLRNV